MEEPDRLRRFLAPGVCRVGDVVTLAPEQSYHLASVLRIAPGERVRIFTGQGDEFIGRVEIAQPKEARVRICEQYESGRKAPANLRLGFAPPPAQRADILIEKATELGVADLHPLICERLQGFRVAAAAGRIERWRRKAEEAARQSQRSVVPRIHAPASLEDFVREASDDLHLIGSTGDARSLWQVLADVSEVPSAVSMVVGPAGGLTRRELELATQAGFVPVSIGPHVLRVETAAICLLAAVGLWLDATLQPNEK